MPRIAEFFGIKIYMYYNDHSPPHFHALYGESEAKVVIETLEYLDGQLPTRAWRMVLEWASLHRSELWHNWQQARDGLSLEQIEPLE
jgi:hypothetical protein